MFLGDRFQKLFEEFRSVNKHGSGEWGLLALYRQAEILKKSFSLKWLVKFEIISQGSYFGDPLQKLFTKF